MVTRDTPTAGELYALSRQTKGLVHAIRLRGGDGAGGLSAGRDRARAGLGEGDAGRLGVALQRGWF